MSQVTINLPDLLRDRLNRLAAAAQRPVEELVIATLNNSVPSPPPGLPADIQKELASLETLSDDDLLSVVQTSMQAKDAPVRYEPGDVTDQLALRKAYALVLLKWRGHRIDELEGIAG